MISFKNDFYYFAQKLASIHTILRYAVLFYIEYFNVLAKNRLTYKIIKIKVNFHNILI